MNILFFSPCCCKITTCVVCPLQGMENGEPFVVQLMKGEELVFFFFTGTKCNAFIAVCNPKNNSEISNYPCFIDEETEILKG